METSLTSGQIWSIIVWILIGLFLMFNIAYFVIRAAKRHNNVDDLIYLEFLIKESEVNKCSRDNIIRMITEYRTRREMDTERLEKLNLKFKKKFDCLKTSNQILTAGMEKNGYNFETGV